jgi:formamidopyrimidine-DNA glycosylase
MPEAPDLQVVKEFLNAHIPGRVVDRAQVLRPMMVRSLATEDFAADVVGRRFGAVERRAKVLSIPLEPDRRLVIHPMLTGRLQYCPMATKSTKRTFFLLGAGDMDLRYLDERQMGFVYYIRPDQLGQVPRLEEQGPDALDEPLTYEEFVQRLKPFRGEIKGILTRGEFVGGIGNAYADEILFAAGISPFKRRRELKEDDLRRLHQAIPQVLNDALAVLRKRVPPDIHVEVRDFLQVHRRGGQPCPRCGHPISELTANKRITSYCRRCQPGSLFKN